MTQVSFPTKLKVYLILTEKFNKTTPFIFYSHTLQVFYPAGVWTQVYIPFF